MTKFSNRLKKTLLLAHFRSIFPIFEGKKHFPRKSGSVTHSFTWDSNTMPNLKKKLIMQFQENTWREEWTEG